MLWEKNFDMDDNVNFDVSVTNLPPLQVKTYQLLFVTLKTKMMLKRGTFKKLSLSNVGMLQKVSLKNYRIKGGNKNYFSDFFGKL